MFTTVNCLVLILFINVVHINGATAPAPEPPAEPPAEPPVKPKYGQCKLNKEELEKLIPKAEKGAQGEKGPKGEQGPVGPPGDCSCKANAETVNTGTQDKPLKNVCKYEKGVIAEKEHFVKPEGIEAFKIHCENENKETCVLAAEEAKEYDNGETAFWLSSKNDWSIEKMYNLNLEQLDWLQRNSQAVTQTIRYHCLNTAPVPKDDANKSLKLLTWSGILIDAATSATSPLHYEVDDAEDHCKDYDPTKPTEWKYTDIKITTKLRGQLPIADLRINDVGKDKKFKIEHRKLCFQ